jgi:sugar lactone lactonase YvrE
MQNLRRRIALVFAAACLLATSALAHPGSGILVDRLGQIYFIDTGSGLWKIDTRGAVSHLSPLRNHWIALDADNRFAQARLPTDPGRDWVLTAAGSNPTMIISTDFPIVMGQDGTLYHPSARETNVRIMRTTAEGRTTPLVTLPRSVAGEALGWINGLTTGPGGSLYYTEDNAVRRITSSGAVSTVATVTPLPKAPGIPGIEERPYLRGLKVDANGIVYVADNADARVLKITSDGKVTTLLQLESPWAPTDVAIFGDLVYVLEYLHTPGDDRLQWMPRVRKITPDGKSTIIMTIDQMPGARAARPAGAIARTNTFWEAIFDLWLRSYFAFGSGSG